MKNIGLFCILIVGLVGVQGVVAIEKHQILGEWTALGSSKTLVDDKGLLKSYYNKGEFVWIFRDDNKLSVVSPGEVDIIPYKISGNYILLDQGGFEGQIEIIEITEKNLIVISPMGSYSYYEKI